MLCVNVWVPLVNESDNGDEGLLAEEETFKPLKLPCI